MTRSRARRLLVGTALVWMILALPATYGYARAHHQARGLAVRVRLRRAGTGRLLSVRFYSRALHRQADYLAYLPPGYEPSHRYPVYYLLHGMPGGPQVFIDLANMDIRLDNQLRDRRVRPMILVYPDGRIGGSTSSDSEWANTPAGDYESYVLDVVNDVDQRFSTLPDRQNRVIAGFSAGAYGAINIALHHVAEFASVQVWSGYFTQTRSGVFAHASKAALDDNSPIDQVTRARTKLASNQLRVFMFVGRDDESSRQIVPMARALKANGATVSYAIYPGGHDWQVWYPRLNQMLILASRDVSQPLPRTIAAARLRPRPAASHRRHPEPHRRWLLGALLLALASAATINLGFLLQHRGLAAHLAGGRRELGQAMLRSRSWLAGQVLGWIGFAAQILAVAIAPLSLVQAFAAGGLALSVPLAAGMFGYRISRAQLLAVLLIAASLATLPIASATTHDRLQSEALLYSALVALLVAAAVVLTRVAVLRAIAAGMLYGVADAAIKAVSVEWRINGSGALVSRWTVLAIVATFGGFLCFQAALRADSPVTAISLMSAFAAILALLCGVTSFGESLGASPAATASHLLAITVVLGCVPVLAAAQQQIANPQAHRTGREHRRFEPATGPGGTHPPADHGPDPVTSLRDGWR